MRPPICSDGGRPMNAAEAGEAQQLRPKLLRDLLRRQRRAARAASAAP